MSSKLVFGGLLVMMIAIASISWAEEAVVEITEKKMPNEILIKVKGDIIGMPGKSITAVPAKYASFRTTPLRELSEESRAIRVEEYFEEKRVGYKKKKVRVPNTYIIKFSIIEDMDIKKIAKAYKKLPSVLKAEVYDREKEEAKKK